jgi:hypothetical protein
MTAKETWSCAYPLRAPTTNRSPSSEIGTKRSAARITQRTPREMRRETLHAFAQQPPGYSMLGVGLCKTWVASSSVSGVSDFSHR